MDWNCNLRPSFVSRPDNHMSFFYNYNYDQYQEMQTSQAALMASTTMDHHQHHNNYGSVNVNYQEKKKQRLTSEQMESLEKSFQEEIKLDPERKMKLAKDLAMEPRQIAVWFQNRRARWRIKELERLYDALKLEYDAVSREKDKLEEEVVALRSVLKEQLGGRIKGGRGGGYNYTEISGEETVESTSIIHTANNQQLPEVNYIDHYNTLLPSTAYWAAAGATGHPTYD